MWPNLIMLPLYASTFPSIMHASACTAALAGYCICYHCTPRYLQLPTTFPSTSSHACVSLSVSRHRRSGRVGAECGTLHASV